MKRIYLAIFVAAAITLASGVAAAAPADQATFHGTLAGAVTMTVHTGTGGQTVSLPAGAQANVNADLVNGAYIAHNAELLVAGASLAAGGAQTIHGSLASPVTLLIGTDHVTLPAAMQLNVNGILTNGSFVVHGVTAVSPAPVSVEATLGSPVTLRLQEPAGIVTVVLPAGSVLHPSGTLEGTDGAYTVRNVTLTVTLPAGNASETIAGTLVSPVTVAIPSGSGTIHLTIPAGTRIAASTGPSSGSLMIPPPQERALTATPAAATATHAVAAPKLRAASSSAAATLPKTGRSPYELPAALALLALGLGTAAAAQRRRRRLLG